MKLVYELFRQDVFMVVYGFTRDHTLAEDACHEAFAKLLEHVDELRDATKLKYWLIRVGLNEAWSRLREQGRLAPNGMDYLSLVRCPADGPEDVVISDEENRAIRILVSRLPLQHRTIVAMRYGLGMGLEEISTILEIPKGTVKSRLSRAVDTLRRRWYHCRQGSKVTRSKGVPEVEAR